MKVLFIGGNGNISWWCTQKAIESGYDVYELNRGMTRSTRRAVQPEVHEFIADIRDEEAVAKVLGENKFDVICDFICFDKTQAERAIHLFSGRTDQYIVISSEAVYQRKSEYLPFREDTPQYDVNVNDPYISGKIMVERTFQKAYENAGFPVTIVRPGYTYDTIIQVPIGQNCFTAPRRFLEGFPLLLPGDGENLVAPLHARDFANAFIHLIGNKASIGEAYHIAAERLITWNEMAEAILGALGVNDKNILHIPYKEAIDINDFCSKVINRQHMWHYIFDHTKIKAAASGWKQTIAFAEGIKETVDWLRADEVRQRINASCDRSLMKLYERYWEGMK